MSKNVYANGMEISAKKSANKSICAMPDVCLSPPSPPAGPIPIPYPNTAKASDANSGSKKVKIKGKEVCLKNKSYYKKSIGDEAATKTLGMGVVTHTIQGKMKHAAWSMDVKFEGKNVVRHMDLTTHNHINNPNIAMQLNQAGLSIPLEKDKSCEELETENSNTQNNDLRDSAKNSGFTTTSSTFKNPGGEGIVFMKATTPNDRIKSSCKNGFVAQRPPGQPIGCQATGMICESDRLANHTEPQLIERIFDVARGRIPMPTEPGGLGTLKMNIFHQPKNSSRDHMPCAHCRKWICAAVSCGLKIILCNNKNEEKDPQCNDNNKPQEKGNWEK